MASTRTLTEDEAMAALAALTARLSGLQVDVEGLYRERDELFVLLRGMDPPVSFGRIGVVAGVSDVAVINAAKKQRERVDGS